MVAILNAATVVSVVVCIIMALRCTYFLYVAHKSINSMQKILNDDYNAKLAEAIDLYRAVERKQIRDLALLCGGFGLWMYWASKALL